MANSSQHLETKIAEWWCFAFADGYTSNKAYAKLHDLLDNDIDLSIFRLRCSQGWRIIVGGWLSSTEELKQRIRRICQREGRRLRPMPITLLIFAMQLRQQRIQAKGRPSGMIYDSRHPE